MANWVAVEATPAEIMRTVRSVRWMIERDIGAFTMSEYDNGSVIGVSALGTAYEFTLRDIRGVRNVHVCEIGCAM